MTITRRFFPGNLFSDKNEMPQVLQSAHIPSLDGLRGISIIMVLTYHMLLAYKITCFNGMFGVNVFFVISGFIITTLLLKEKRKSGDISLRKFYIRRFLKIIPLAWLYLVVVALINSYYKMITQQDIISAALFIKNTSIIPTHWEAATGHFWSLSVEEQFYIIFPFILKKNTNGYVVALLLLIVAIPLLPVLEGHREGVFHTNAMHIFVDTMRYMTPILTGSLFAVLVFRKAISERLYPNNMITNLLILFLAYEIYCGAGPLAGLYYKSFLSAALTAIVIVNNITPSGDLFFRLLNSRALVLIGMASYSIYVWQQVFLMAHPWAQAGSEWLELAVVLVISFLSYYFIERKLAAIKSRFR